MALISDDDKLIWNLPTGSRLACIQSVVMTDDQIVAFTAGRIYFVESMHPIADPAYVRLTNDQGEPHKMTGEHIRQFFSLKP